VRPTSGESDGNAGVVVVESAVLDDDARRGAET
jgi:hypothetical protein